MGGANPMGVGRIRKGGNQPGKQRSSVVSALILMPGGGVGS